MGGWIYTQVNKCPSCGYEGRICKEPEIQWLLVNGCPR